MIWPWIVAALAVSVVVSSWVGLAAVYCWVRWRRTVQGSRDRDLLEAGDLAQEWYLTQETRLAAEPVEPPAGVSRPTRTGAAPTHPVGGVLIWGQFVQPRPERPAGPVSARMEYGFPTRLPPVLGFRHAQARG
jgi:hypothetical protein